MQNLAQYAKIVVLGFPRSGKTTLVEELETTGDFFLDYKFVYSDDFWTEGNYEDALISLIAAIDGVEKYVVEGVLCFRLLRKIEQLRLDNLRPQCIVFTKSRQSETDTPFARGLDKIWGDFVTLAKENKSDYQYIEFG